MSVVPTHRSDRHLYCMGMCMTAAALHSTQTYTHTAAHGEQLTSHLFDALRASGPLCDIKQGSCRQLLSWSCCMWLPLTGSTGSETTWWYNHWPTVAMSPLFCHVVKFSVLIDAAHAHIYTQCLWQTLLGVLLTSDMRMLTLRRPSTLHCGASWQGWPSPEVTRG